MLACKDALSASFSSKREEQVTGNIEYVLTFDWCQACHVRWRSSCGWWESIDHKYGGRFLKSKELSWLLLYMFNWCVITPCLASHKVSKLKSINGTLSIFFYGWWDAHLYDAMHVVCFIVCVKKINKTHSHHQQRFHLMVKSAMSCPSKSSY